MTAVGSITLIIMTATVIAQIGFLSMKVSKLKCQAVQKMTVQIVDQHDATICFERHNLGSGHLKISVDTPNHRGKFKRLLVSSLLASAGLARADAVRFDGVMSNSFFVGNQLVEKSRKFQATVDGANSAYVVEDSERGTKSSAAFKAGEYSYTFVGPFTNKNGQVSTPIAARIENRDHPRDDGSWINYLWLGFGSHHYFTSHLNQAIEPIWLTGLHESNEDNLGLSASYTPLPNSSYPKFVAYISDGYEYFEGKKSGALLRKRLRHPFDLGFTNIILNLYSYTNLDDELYPTEFEISRFGVQNMWQTNASLKLLVRSRVFVTSIEKHAQPVSNPEFKGQIYAMDATASAPGQRAYAVHVPMTNGNWPDSSETARLYEKQKKIAEQAKAEVHNQGSKRKIVLVGLLTVMFLLPLALLSWKMIARKVGR